jgi:hypothetical protein
MANTNPIILKYRRKLAELGQLDNEISKLDMTLPEGEGEKTFDYLAQKRTEIEEEIKGMQEKVQLLTAWSRFKEGPWSEALKAELDGMDENIGDIATSGKEPADEPLAETGMGAPPGAMPSGPEMPPEPPPAEGMPPEPPPAEASPELPPMPEGTSEVPPEPPPASPALMQASKKGNYAIPDKKGIIGPNSEREKIMANDTKTSLKEKLADLKTNREAITREAKTRVAAAWTIAKTMLPTAPVEAQKAFAQTLLANKTSALKAALKQTAINAHYTRLADFSTQKEVHRDEMNSGSLMEKNEDLAAQRSAVKSEISGPAKNAAPKRADDRKDSGPQTPTYNDGRGHGGGTASEPKEVDAGKAAERPGAGERPGDTVNLSEGKSTEGKGDGAPKAAGKAAAKCLNCKGGKMCAKCAAKAAAARSKKAEFPPAPDAPPAEAPPMDAGMPPAEDPMAQGMPPADGMPPVEGGMPPAEGGMPPMGPEGAEPAATEMVTEEKIQDIKEKVEEVQQDILELEQSVSGEEAAGEEVPAGVLESEGEELEGIGEELEGEGEVVEGEGNELEGEGSEQELNLDQIFNEESMEEKTSALANEDNSGADFFAPSAAMDMEATLDDNGVQEFGDVVASMFSRAGADDDPLFALMGGIKSAAQVAGMEVVPSFTGEAAKHFEQSETSKEARDNESDHADDLWAETIKVEKPEDSEQKRSPQDAVPELKGPASGKAPESEGKAAAIKTAVKPAAKKPATLRKIKPIIASDRDVPKNFDLAKALLGEEEL